MLFNSIKHDQITELYLANNNINDNGIDIIKSNLSNLKNLINFSILGNSNKKNINLYENIKDEKLKKRYEKIFNILNNVIKGEVIQSEIDYKDEDLMNELVNYNNKRLNFILPSLFLEIYWKDKKDYPLGDDKDPLIKSLKLAKINKYQLNLKGLYKELSNINIIPLCLYNLSSLKILDLSDNDIENQQLRGILTAFKNLTNLEELIMCNTKISDDKDLCANLSSLKKLKKITLSSTCDITTLNDRDIEMRIKKSSNNKSLIITTKMPNNNYY